MTYILSCATKEARPTEPSASLAEVQRTEKDKRTFSLHCSFLTPLLYNEEKASMEVPRRWEEDLGNQQNADKSKRRGFERIVVWWCIFIGHLSASGKQDSTSSCDTPKHSSSSSSEDSVPVLQLTLLPAHRVKGPPGRVPSVDLIHDSFVTESSTWSHPIQFEWHIKQHSRTPSVGATPEAGYARSASSSLHCCLLGFDGPWSRAHTAAQHSPSGSHSLRASAGPGCR